MKELLAPLGGVAESLCPMGSIIRIISRPNNGHYLTQTASSGSPNYLPGIKPSVLTVEVLAIGFLR